MKNQNIYISIVIILAAIGAGLYLMHRKVEAPASAPVSSLGAGATGADDGSTAVPTGDQTFALSCDGGKTMNLTVHLPEDKSVDLALDDGRSMNLLNVSTADTVAYASADGDTTLSMNGSTLSLIENGSTTYSNCSIDQSSSDADGGGDY